MITTANRFLSMAEITENAQYILNKFLANGWTKQAVCGMLGNMQTESNCNSGIWEGLQENNMNGGFGLTQWTPATKYTTWADSNGYEWTDIDGQIARIQYESENEIQWGITEECPMFFKDFITSTDTPTQLAKVFIYNYEKPAIKDQPDRGIQAEYWYNVLNGDTPEPEPEPVIKRHKMKIFMYRLF